MAEMMTATVDGLTLSFSNWAERTGIDADLMRWRKRNGWTDRQIVGVDPRPPQQPNAGSMRRGPMHRLNVLFQFTPLELITRTVVQIDDRATGQECKRIRMAAGKSAEAAGREFGCSGDTIYKIESGGVAFTQVLLDRFNQIAAGWVVTTSTESQGNE